MAYVSIKDIWTDIHICISRLWKGGTDANVSDFSNFFSYLIIKIKIKKVYSIIYITIYLETHCILQISTSKY